jgi:hypothetical protein
VSEVIFHSKRALSKGEEGKFQPWSSFSLMIERVKLHVVSLYSDDVLCLAESLLMINNSVYSQGPSSIAMSVTQYRFA